MTELDKLYESWMIKGSYLNNMLDCGDRYNRWVEIALGYLPVEILDEHKENLVFISTAQVDACRVARHYCENREVILLSDRILPKQHAVEDQPEVRNFIFTVLHEIVHAIKKHKSPKFDGLSEEQNQAQEDEADELAFEWYNQHIKELDNEYLPPLSKEEVEIIQKRNLELMERIYIDV
jgi:hypothetical protein